ncbi:uncharacterized protein BXZ73DRAFT_108185 [Epithele typhae]|uniref:uncharacterized protein n=1 Tax=Epithele typhae TaxID=378194 RepID=UPI002007AD10|nr:uncharacterized protein BXZ73DRAFT_108185 [Epithele typhae]KAH9911171.1 hypothetical protein BXZ73DRAFT_108185 [Epithele typhae]
MPPKSKKENRPPAGSSKVKSTNGGVKKPVKATKGSPGSDQASVTPTNKTPSKAKGTSMQQAAKSNSTSGVKHTSASMARDKGDAEAELVRLRAKVAELEKESRKLEASAKKSRRRLNHVERLIPKPKGTVGKDLRLQHEMGLNRNKPLYSQCLASVRDASKSVRLDILKGIRSQDRKKMGDLYDLARHDQPYLKRFQGDWAITQILIQYLSNRRKKAIRDGTAVITEDEHGHRVLVLSQTALRPDVKKVQAIVSDDSEDSELDDNAHMIIDDEDGILDDEEVSVDEGDEDEDDADNNGSEDDEKEDSSLSSDDDSSSLDESHPPSGKEDANNGFNEAQARQSRNEDDDSPDRDHDNHDDEESMPMEQDDGIQVMPRPDVQDGDGNHPDENVEPDTAVNYTTPATPTKPPSKGHNRAPEAATGKKHPEKGKTTSKTASKKTEAQQAKANDAQKKATRANATKEKKAKANASKEKEKPTKAPRKTKERMTKAVKRELMAQGEDDDENEGEEDVRPSPKRRNLGKVVPNASSWSVPAPLGEHDCTKDHVRDWPGWAREFVDDGGGARVVRLAFTRSTLAPVITRVFHLELAGRRYEDMMASRNVWFPPRAQSDVDAILAEQGAGGAGTRACGGAVREEHWQTIVPLETRSTELLAAQVFLTRADDVTDEWVLGSNPHDPTTSTMFYPRDAPLLMRHTTPSHLASLNGSGDDMLTSGAYGTSKDSAHVTHLARHRGSGVARASPSSPPHGHASDSVQRLRAAPHVRPRTRLTHFKPAGGSCAFNGNPPTCDRLRDQSYVQAQ